MVKIPIFNPEGVRTGEYDAESAVFGVKVNSARVHEAVLALASGARRPYAHTKNRGEVAGSGRKPWKQKGTGRARAGSVRSPLWRKGGVIFGPRSIRNFSKKVNIKVRKQAFCMALSDKVSEQKLFLVEPFSIVGGKTKKAAALIAAIIAKKPKALVVYESENSEMERATRNIPGITCVHADAVNTRDVVRSPYLITSKSVIQKFEKTYSQPRKRGME